MHLLHALRVLDHLHLGDIIRPGRIAQELCDLATQVKELAHNGLVHCQTVLKLLIRDSPSVRVLRGFELRDHTR